MSRNVTTVYRSYSTADLVRRELENFGISRGYIHVIPDRERSSTSTGTTAADTTGAGATGTAPGGIGTMGTGTLGAGGVTGAPVGGSTASATGAGSGTGYESDLDRYLSDIDDLYLPDEDARTYKHCVRKGDYVVSAEVSDDQVSRVVEIMRRPEAEAYDLDTRSDEFRSESDIPRREGWVADENRLGTRDTAHTDPYTRSYQRKDRLTERR